MSTFVKLMRSEQATFLDCHPNANHLLNVIARRARRTPCTLNSLSIGESFIGFKTTGLTEQQYRTSKKNLEKWGLVSFRVARKLTGGVTAGVTVTKLLNSDVYDINTDEGNATVTPQQRHGNVTVTSNKECKNDKNDNKDLVEDLPQRSKFKFLDDDYRCAEWIYSLVVKVATSTKKPNFESWANTIRMMRELDKLTYQDISDVFTWANKDSFWATNILSVTKLRKQFPQLQAKMKGANNGSNQTPSKKLSAYERARAVNDQYRQPEPNECELVVGANDGHMGRAVDAGTGGVTIEHVGNGTFVDYE